jgi:hypothetical protein
VGTGAKVPISSTRTQRVGAVGHRDWSGPFSQNGRNTPEVGAGSVEPLQRSGERKDLRPCRPRRRRRIAVRYLVDLILEDERRHHRVLRELSNHVRAVATFEERDPRVPALDIKASDGGSE